MKKFFLFIIVASLQAHAHDLAVGVYEGVTDSLFSSNKCVLTFKKEVLTTRKGSSHSAASTGEESIYTLLVSDNSGKTDTYILSSGVEDNSEKGYFGQDLSEDYYGRDPDYVEPFTKKVSGKKMTVRADLHIYNGYGGYKMERNVLDIQFSEFVGAGDAAPQFLTWNYLYNPKKDYIPETRLKQIGWGLERGTVKCKYFKKVK